MTPLPATTAGGAMAPIGRCATCSSPLAPDQLFCLSCGARRREARIAFRDVLATEALPVVQAGGGGGGYGMVPAGAVATEPAGPGRVTYMPFLATLAVLLFALGIGFWIGRNPTTATAATGVPLQTIAATTPATTPESAAADDAAANDEEEDAAADEDAPPAADTSEALKKLENLSPEEYQKQSQKLPDEVGTGGTPPPKDNKPAGGGSDFEEFN